MSRFIIVVAGTLTALFITTCCGHPEDHKRVCAGRIVINDNCEGEVPCPRNSPDTNLFPINGFDADGIGRCNDEGVQVVPRSMQGGKCPTGAELGLSADGKRLIGQKDAQTCEGEALRGATLKVRTDRETIQLTIRDVLTFEEGSADAKPTKYEGYLFDAGAGSLCRSGPAAYVRGALGLTQIPTHEAGIAAPAYADYAVVGIGPVRDEHNHAIEMGKGRWFNLACAADGLAKLRFYEKDLYREGNELNNVAALEMLTGRYCGTPYTLHGIEIHPLPRDSRSDTESLWNEHGATCVESPRILGAKIAGMTIPEDLPDELQPGNCKRNGAAKGQCGHDAWIEQLRLECQQVRKQARRMPACDSPWGETAYFESRVYQDVQAPNRLWRPRRTAGD